MEAFYADLMADIKKYEDNNALCVNQLFSLLKFDKFKEMILNFKKDLAATYEVNEDDTGVLGEQ